MWNNLPRGFTPFFYNEAEAKSTLKAETEAKTHVNDCGGDIDSWYDCTVKGGGRGVQGKIELAAMIAQMAVHIGFKGHIAQESPRKVDSRDK